MIVHLYLNIASLCENMDIITFVIVASIATPLFGSGILLTQKLRHCCSACNTQSKDEDMSYVELPRKKTVHTIEYTPKTRISFLNKTLLEAASCNCPMLCELLIQRGADDVENALDIAIINGHLDVCKIILNNCACDTQQALETANTHKKHHIAKYIATYDKKTE